jgi:hypothetical protein
MNARQLLLLLGVIGTPVLAAAKEPVPAPAPSIQNQIMTPRGVKQAVSLAAKHDPTLGVKITNTKSMRVYLNEQPTALGGWVGFRAYGATDAKGHEHPMTGQIQMFKGKVIGTEGHPLPRVQDLELIKAAPKK